VSSWQTAHENQELIKPQKSAENAKSWKSHSYEERPLGKSVRRRTRRWFGTGPKTNSRSFCAFCASSRLIISELKWQLRQVNLLPYPFIKASCSWCRGKPASKSFLCNCGGLSVMHSPSPLTEMSENRIAGAPNPFSKSSLSLPLSILLRTNGCG